MNTKPANIVGPIIVLVSLIAGVAILFSASADIRARKAKIEGRSQIVSIDCERTCKPFGGADWESRREPVWRLICNDDAYFVRGEPVEACAGHHGTRSLENLTASDPFVCKCKDGGLFKLPQKDSQ